MNENAATIDVGRQGLWLVQVESCNEAGCSTGSTATTPVIINIRGHLALRVWFDFPERDSNSTDNRAATRMHLDWDALDGHYLVKYRLSGGTNWVTSSPLSETGYRITAEDAEALDGEGYPIVRVYFNCNENGEGCTELGRFPAVNVQPTGPGGHSTGIRSNNRTEIQPTSTATKDESTNRSKEARKAQTEADPVTNILRPASDYTVTHETGDDGITRRCISRATENAWETGMFGMRTTRSRGALTGQLWTNISWTQRPFPPTEP